MFDGADGLVTRSVADRLLELRVEDAHGQVVASLHLLNGVFELFLQPINTKSQCRMTLDAEILCKL